MMGMIGKHKSVSEAGGVGKRKTLSTKAGKLKRVARRLKKAAKAAGTLNIILALVAIFFVWFNCQMLAIYRRQNSIPETYACAVVAATIGECGICGWIRTTKDRRQERKWQKDDEKESEGEQHG